MKNKMLNDNQTTAVHMPLGPVMVIAGPGSGKTFVITERVYHMIHNLACDPRKILVITFTKAAAQEMQSRYQKKDTTHSVAFGTFHSIFYRMLRNSDPVRYGLDRLIQEDKKKQFIEKIYASMDVSDDYEDFVEVFLGHLTLMQNQLIQPRFYNPDGLSKELFLSVYQAYESYKERQGLFDFDDMLTHTYYLLQNDSQILKFYQERYKHILIDEFQDINCVQFEIIKLLAGNQPDLFVVGDDDQSIYQFRGAKPEFLLSFENYFKPVKKVILDVNYRSTENILRYSNNLIGYNTIRYEKHMLAHQGTGVNPTFVYCEDSNEQATKVLEQLFILQKQQIPLHECAVIYRTNVQARPIIEALRKAQLPFVIKDAFSTLYDQWVTKDILAYLRLAHQMGNVEWGIQIINRPSRYISKVAIQEAMAQGGHFLNTLSQLQSLNRSQRDRVEELIFHLQRLATLSLLDAIRYIRHMIGYEHYMLDYAKYRKIPSEGLVDLLEEIEDSAKGYPSVEEWEESMIAVTQSIKQSMRDKSHQGISLSTMHSAKGLEFQAVFLIDIVDGIIPHNKSLGELQLEEERRLFYVGLTRAKKHLYLMIPKSRHQKKTESSPFVLEMLHPKVILKEGERVKHKIYGRGIIEKIEGSKATIRFKTTQKVLDYLYCMKHHLLYQEEEHV
ncbi:MAG: ATP-dependent helicase [Niameybacter sp.]|uniref:ATP-dependent helicase n=1 Tax=Niameybacter sp. TaxID=2033640 RepID=UPI002FC7FCAC